MSKAWKGTNAEFYFASSGSADKEDSNAAAAGGRGEVDCRNDC
jgi:hypothetical protein